LSTVQPRLNHGPKVLPVALQFDFKNITLYAKTYLQ